MAVDQEFDNIDPESIAVSGLPNFIPAQAKPAPLQETAAQPEAAVVPSPSPEPQAPTAADATTVDPIVATDAVSSVEPTDDASSAPTESRAYDVKENKIPERSHAGVLVEHGEDHYQHNPNNKKNYYVTLDTVNGPETIWGVDLGRAMKESGSSIGDPVKLDYMGSEQVIVDRDVRNEAGVVVGQEQIETNRNTWAVKAISEFELNQIYSASLKQGSDKDDPAKPLDDVKPVVDVLEPADLATDAEAVADDRVSEGASTESQKKKAQAALDDFASTIKPSGRSVNPADLASVNASLQPDPAHASIPGAGATRGQEQVRTGAEALIEGGASLLGGAASLTGSVLKGVGKGAAGLAAAISGAGREKVEAVADADFSDAGALDFDGGVNSNIAAGEPQPEPLALDAPRLNDLQPATPVTSATAGEPAVASQGADGDAETSRVTVLPRLSEYRVDQVDRAASNYQKAHENFWQAHRMPLIRQEIESRAEAAGLTPQDVIEKMKPNGEFADLHEKFNKAVAQSPDAQIAKKAMDKALDGWTKQYGRAQEELLNPETEGSPHYDKLKDRLGRSSDSMHKNAADIPAFEGEQSHMEKLKDAMLKLVERLKEMAQNFVNFVRGKSGKSAEAGGADHAPAP
ncbi:hypothetical protein [Pseudomonas amygdali]|uniref:hypothetical protein n=1 Tax=Pseudomonas amygdali TaxID=47877 RepID=UPI0006E5A654|nr:hypothetical protein [Pseudomonas amygdali]KPY55609.1 hypothetical protein ALO93_200243 [Pseudomonas amygdali pv. sesami]